MTLCRRSVGQQARSTALLLRFRLTRARVMSTRDQLRAIAAEFDTLPRARKPSRLRESAAREHAPGASAARRRQSPYYSLDEDDDVLIQRYLYEDARVAPASAARTGASARAAPAASAAAAPRSGASSNSRSRARPTPRDRLAAARALDTRSALDLLSPLRFRLGSVGIPRRPKVCWQSSVGNRLFENGIALIRRRSQAQPVAGSIGRFWVACFRTLSRMCCMRSRASRFARRDWMSSACSLAEPSSSGSCSFGSSSIRGVGAGAASDCTPSAGRGTQASTTRWLGGAARKDASGQGGGGTGADDCASTATGGREAARGARRRATEAPGLHDACARAPPACAAAAGTRPLPRWTYRGRR